MLTVTSADYEVLRAAGLPTNCIGPELAVLLYRETSLGVSEAATFPTYSCPSRRIVILDRKRVIKAL